MVEALGGLLGETLRKIGLGGAATAIYWKEIVGEEVDRHTKLLYQKGKTLFVAADNPVWGQELSLQKAAILERLEQKIGKGKIKDIKFICRGIEEEQTHEERTERQENNETGLEGEENVENLLAAVRDRETREGLRRLLKKAGQKGQKK